MCAQDVLDDFEVTVQHAYHSAGESGDVPVKDNDLKEYMIGKSTDRTLIDKVRNEKLGALSGGSSTTLVIGDRNYGSDSESFLAALEGDEQQKHLIKEFIERNAVPIIVRTPRIADALQAVWDIDWHSVLSIATTEEFVDQHYSEKPKQPVTEVLLKVRRDFASKDVVAKLPVFFKPGPVTRAADALAKAAKVGGITMMNDEVTRCDLKDTKSRAVAAAMFLAADSDLPVILQKEDKEFTGFLKPFARQLIDAEGQKYTDAMNTLLMA